MNRALRMVLVRQRRADGNRKGSSLQRAIAINYR
jgi:hypothetical protein